MTTVYVLILLTKWGYGHASLTQEFTSKQSCEQAIVDFQKAWHNSFGVVAVCVEK